MILLSLLNKLITKNIKARLYKCKVLRIKQLINMAKKYEATYKDIRDNVEYYGYEAKTIDYFNLPEYPLEKEPKRGVGAPRIYGDTKKDYNKCKKIIFEYLNDIDKNIFITSTIKILRAKTAYFGNKMSYIGLSKALGFASWSRFQDYRDTHKVYKELFEHAEQWISLYRQFVIEHGLVNWQAARIYGVYDREYIKYSAEYEKQLAKAKEQTLKIDEKAGKVNITIQGQTDKKHIEDYTGS